VVKDAKSGSKGIVVAADKIPADMMGVDIGFRSIGDIKVLIGKAKTIVWNGPMGIFEIEEYAKGTVEIAKAVADATAKGAVSVVGGGDSVAALEKFNLAEKISHVSTGGGASLEFLEGIELPGVKVLKDR
jgi:3-phosphoglycerate kinase